MQNTPTCRNCHSDIEPDSRICVKCGAPQWFVCDYCSEELPPPLTSAAKHEVFCDEKEIHENSVFDY